MLKFSGCPCLNSGRTVDERGCRSLLTDAPPSPAGRPAGPGVQQRHAILLSREGLTYRSVVPTSKGNPAQASALQLTRSLEPGQPGPPFFPMGRAGEGGETDTEAGMLSTEVSSAICVQRFDDSHYLQFTLRIAFRCVLHRYGSQDIRC